jgi:hypothetical protein
MQRKIEAKTRGELFVEHLVWNAAAGAALAVMVLLLLCSLQWLDQVTARISIDAAPAAAPTQLARPAANADDRTTEVAAINRPSG